MFDYLIFIGRFQPFHNGHYAVVKQALAQAKQVIILLGSANTTRTLRNPFTISERTAMIKQAFSAEDAARIQCVALDDCLYNDTRWVNTVQSLVKNQVAQSYRMYDDATAEDVNAYLNTATLGLIGHSKDQSSYYLSLFPTWKNIDVANYRGLSSTTIRDAFLLNQPYAQEDVPVATQAFLTQFQATEAYQTLHQEALFIQRYKQQWAAAPYAPTFVTTDAVVVQSGHILLVERKAMPGAGQLALPGGFLNQNETMLEGCIRELREETRLKVPEPVLRGSLKQQKTYDDPYRSARGRTVTQAFYFALRNDPQGLPKVKGGDDARRAFWLPLGDVKAEDLFEDHYAIISDLIGI